jgi:hypothetical protein
MRRAARLLTAAKPLYKLRAAAAAPYSILGAAGAGAAKARAPGRAFRRSGVAVYSGPGPASPQLPARKWNASTAGARMLTWRAAVGGLIDVSGGYELDTI